MAEGCIQDDVLPAKKSVCDLCDTKTDNQLSECLDCNVYICRRCSMAHQRVLETKYHNIVAGIEQTHSQSQNISRMCRIHIDEVILYHCTPCNKLICSECILGDHKGHNGVKFKDYANQKRKKISVKLQQARVAQESEIVKISKQIEDMEKESDDNAKDTENKIKDRKIQIIAEVDKIFNDLSQQRTKIHQQNKNKLEAAKAQVTQGPQKFEQYSELLRIGADIEVVMAETEMYRNLELVPPADANIDIGINMSCVVSDKTDDKTLVSLCGSVQSYDISSDASRNAELSPLLQFVPQLHCPDFKASSDKGESSDASLLAKSTPRRGFDPQLQSVAPRAVSGADSSSDLTPHEHISSLFASKTGEVRSICPTSDDTALIHYLDSYYNDIVSVSGQVKQTLKFDFKANDVIMTSDGSIIAADSLKPSLHKLTKAGDVIQTINIAPLMPVGLCEARHGHLLVTLVDKPSHTVDNVSRRLISKLTMEGTTVESYEYQNRSRLFTWPHGVSENINGDICVVDVTGVSSGRLVVIDNKGKVKYTYEGQQIRHLFDPVHVKCDNCGHVIVNDRRNIKVHMLDIDGQFIRYIVDWDNLKVSYFPCCLALETNGVLWVGCVEGSVYRLKYLK